MHLDDFATTSQSQLSSRNESDAGRRDQTRDAPPAHHAGQNFPRPPSTHGQLPNRLVTALEVAQFVGCHEESVRRAYLCGQLKRQRFGVRSWRFHPADVLDWIARGAPTRIS